MYVLDVPYGHPLHAKIQRCPCVIRPRVTEHLARAASPALAAAELAAIQIQNRPYTDVQWGRRTFTPAEQQVILHHAVRRAAETAAAAPQKGLTLIGPPGSGKTTIAVSAARELAVRNNLALRFASVPKLLDDIRRESADHTPAALLDKLIDAPVLLLDDIGREKLTAWAREKLFRLLDERMRRHTPEAPRITFLTSNLSFAELYALDSALASRIASNTEVLLCVVSDYRLVTAS
jgi:DNA replication protein DnaC